MARPLLVISILSGVFCLISSAVACVTCNKKLKRAIFGSAFYPHFFVVVLPFIVLSIAVFAVALMFNARSTSTKFAGKPNPFPLLTASLIIGMGVGGFIDGIVFHQILQWHEMLSNQIPPDTLLRKSVNMFWDGIFHAFCLLVVLTGIVLLWKAGRTKNADLSSNVLLGGLLGGWAAFNVVEGVIDHHILELHNVREVADEHWVWNYGLLLFSGVTGAIAWRSLRHVFVPW